MKLMILLGTKWATMPQLYTRNEAINLLRHSTVPARMVNALTGAVVAAKVL